VKEAWDWHFDQTLATLDQIDQNRLIFGDAHWHGFLWSFFIPLLTFKPIALYCSPRDQLKLSVTFHWTGWLNVVVYPALAKFTRYRVRRSVWREVREVPAYERTLPALQLSFSWATRVVSLVIMHTHARRAETYLASLRNRVMAMVPGQMNFSSCCVYDGHLEQ